MRGMKMQCLSLAALMCGLPSVSALATEATLESVRLYRSGGESVRVIRLEAAPEGGRLVIGRLPGSTEPEGLRANLRVGVGLRLGSIRFERLSPEVLPKTARREVKEEERRGLVRQMEDLEGELGAISRRGKVFGSLREAFLKGMEEDPSAVAAEQVWEAFAGEEAALAERRARERELSGRLEDLKLAIQGVDRELQDIIQEESALNGEVTLELLGQSDGPVVVELVSRFNGAGWSPVYRVEALPAAGRWKLDYQASLYNRTGEGWDSVPVTLLTGRPGWRMEAAELPPVFLQKQEPVQLYASRQAKADFAAAPLAMSMEAAPPAPEVERLTTQFTLSLPAPVSLAPVEEGKVVNLRRTAMEAQFWSETAPSVEEKAYLHGESTVDLEWPILPGPATLLVDGAVSGRTQLPLVNPGDILELGFGENPAILVDFKVLDELARNTGVFDKVRRYQRHYEAEIRNLMPVAHPVHVKSRFPLSRDAQIEVKRLEPTGVQVDEETGRFQWETALPAGDEAVFTTRFEVSAPRDWDLSSDF